MIYSERLRKYGRVTCSAILALMPGPQFPYSPWGVLLINNNSGVQINLISPQFSAVTPQTRRAITGPYCPITACPLQQHLPIDLL